MAASAAKDLYQNARLLVVSHFGKLFYDSVYQLVLPKVVHKSRILSLSFHLWISGGQEGEDKKSGDTAVTLKG